MKIEVGGAARPPRRGRPRRMSGALRLLAVACVSRIAGADAATAPGLNDFEAGRVAEAFQAWSQAANSGDPDAALYIGVLYDTGIGVEQDYSRALEWYRRAAEGGNPTAMFNVAVMYDSGRGVAPDRATAAEWYRRAAAKRMGRAEYNLALMYERGAGIPRDRKEAVRLFRDAARDGVPAARRHLIRLGMSDTGVGEVNTDVAMRNFEQAQRVLLTRGVAEAAQAVELFRAAAEEGNALAQYDLAYCYEHGIGVKKDPAQAIVWYQRAATTAGNDSIRTIAEAAIRNLGQAAR